MVKHFAKFQIDSIKDVAGVAGTRSESAMAITPPKMAKPCAHIHIIRKQSTKFQINLKKGVGGVNISDGWKNRRADAHTDG